MPSKKITTSRKSSRQESEYKKPRPIRPLGGGFQGGLLSSNGTGMGR